MRFSINTKDIHHPFPEATVSSLLGSIRLLCDCFPRLETTFHRDQNSYTEFRWSIWKVAGAVETRSNGSWFKNGKGNFRGLEGGLHASLGLAWTKDWLLFVASQGNPKTKEKFLSLEGVHGTGSSWDGDTSLQSSKRSHLTTTRDLGRRLLR